jgi:hypothetical protein
VHASFKLGPYVSPGKEFSSTSKQLQEQGLKKKDNVAKGIVLHHMKNGNKRGIFPSKSKVSP